MQSPMMRGPMLPVFQPRMSTANLKKQTPCVSARPVFRRQNSPLHQKNPMNQPVQQRVTPAMAAPMQAMPRMATAGIIGRPAQTRQPTAPMSQKRQYTHQPFFMSETAKTVVMPPKPQAYDGTPKMRQGGASPVYQMPRQDTGVSRASFVPSYHVTGVYPPPQVFSGQKPAKQMNMAAPSPSRQSTAAAPQFGARAAQPQGRNNTHVAFRGRNQAKTTSAQREPSVFNKMVSTIKEHTSILPKIETKEATQLIGGFVTGTLSVLAHIVGDIRGDIINGLFKSDDPSYDAAKAYYYATNGNPPPVPSAMTHRIDYLEEIEKCTMSRCPSARGRQNTGMRQRMSTQPLHMPTPTAQPMHMVAPPTPQVHMVRPQTQKNFEYAPQFYDPPPKPVVQQPQVFGQDPQMFSMMSERTLEEFLLNDGYLNSAPPSIPR
ncbi:hypothetical protein BgAZ_106050 [Babesia gibsoni]|uniref:Uncharacterized protein n=1 Tax=Babesia gibsoni TaxID=33632 RepID=A0AAD8PG14_BABGI|nr:hypothetical protein BgAZ_106050 [Babesia gibsoni]